MRYSFVTIFPNLIDGYFKDSILKKAIDKGFIEIDFYNPRDYSKNKHKKVDDTPFGGGAGMVMTPQPLFECLSDIKNKNKDSHFIFLTPVAKQFNQKDAKRLSKKKHIVFVSGRYEGIDERVIEEFADEVFSIGDFILTGGEIASLALADSISRCVDGVLGNKESLYEESFEVDLLESPTFTKPQVFNSLSVISEFLKGNHSKIRSLKFALSKAKTKYFRPKMLIEAISKDFK